MISFEQWQQAEKMCAGLKDPIFSENPRETLFYRDAKADCAFRCVGHSMAPTFYPGELVFIKDQETFKDGQICRVMIGEGCTLKRVYKLKNGFRLVPENKLFLPVDITGTDAKQVKIVGVAVGRGIERKR